MAEHSGKDILSSDVEIEGSIKFQKELLIDGKVKGEIISDGILTIGEIVAKAQDEGTFKREVSPRFAALAFYGAIEQVLTGWIFEVLPRGDDEYEHAKDYVVETICGGLDRLPADA